MLQPHKGSAVTPVDRDRDIAGVASTPQGFGCNLVAINEALIAAVASTPQGFGCNTYYDGYQ